MKRFLLLLLLLFGLSSVAQAQKIYEYLYNKSNHYNTNNQPVDQHTQAELVGKKLYFIYHKDTDSFSLANESGKVQIPGLMTWNDTHRCYFGLPGDYLIFYGEPLADEFYISEKADVLLIITSDKDGYDVGQVYWLQNIKEL